MKTVFKKLLSIVLVAMLLVSAVPFASAVEEDGGVKVSLIVYDKNDETVESLGPIELEEGDLKYWQKNSSTIAAEVLEVFGSKFTADQVKSVAVMGNSVVIVLNTTAGGNVDTAAEYTLTVNTGKGTYTVKVNEGEEYLDVLSAPARPGYEFLGWKSENLGKIGEGDSVMGDDTVTALWSSATEYFLSLDENRDNEESLIYGVTVTYGDEELYEKVMKYQPERKGYVFMGWKLNGKIIDEDDVYELQDDATAYAVWKLESDTEDEPMNGSHTKDGKVYLEIYKNGDTSKYVKRVDITDYADDNKISRTEAETVAKKYVTAKTGYKLSFDGLFDEETWYWYTRDEETDGAASVIVNRDGDDYVYVMVNNVKDVAADTTNPKTGDVIAIALGTMMSSAAGAAYLFLNKKNIVK